MAIEKTEQKQDRCFHENEFKVLSPEKVCGSTGQMVSLTVAMPVFNAMPYLPEAVESILAQTLHQFRFIIINDGSTDDSASYLEAISDPRVTVVHQKNRGLGATLNRSFKLCESEYYARMDADDFSLPERLETQFDFMKANKNIVLLGSQVAFKVGKTICKAPRMPMRHESIERLLMKGRIGLCHSSIMLRMDAVRKIQGYRIGGAGEDFDFFIRMGEVGKLSNLNTVLHQYRIHFGSIVATKQLENRMGIAYAIECMRHRRSGRSEPSFGHFEESWHQRGVVRRIGDAIDLWSGLQYRKGLLDFSKNKRMSGATRLACVAMCRPCSSVRHALTRVLRG